MMQGIVVFQPVGKRAAYKTGRSVMDIAREAGVGIASICGGEGQCGKCRVRLEGKTSPPTAFEKKYLGADEIAAGYRLACQAFPEGEVTVYVPLTSATQAQRLQTAGREMNVDLDPAVRKYLLEMTLPSLDDHRSDQKRVSDALKKITGKDIQPPGLNVLTGLAGTLRDCDWRVTAVVRDDELAAVEPLDTRDNLYGLAVDLGTTKIAVYLVDLNTGRAVDAAGAMNPQTEYGEDVISRIKFTMDEPNGGEVLRRTALAAIGQTASDLCVRHNISLNDLYETAVVGNTCMHHIVLGLPVRQLGLTPFIPVTVDSLTVRAADIGLPGAPGAGAYFPSPIAGFVGSDHLAMLLSSNVQEAAGNVLAVDIGTNTEVALKTDQGIVSCSTASGPAFEGARIKCGMRASAGAVDKVSIEAGTGKVTFTTIDDAAAVGICGSGTLDAVAEMLAAGILSEKGKMRDAPGIRMGEGGLRELFIAPGATDGCDIVVTQQDVVEIQLAKGAIRAGVEVLLEHKGLSPADINRVVLAGAFGTYIDVAGALAIGMFPQLPERIFDQVGNAAGAGVTAMLESHTLRSQAETLARQIEYLELTSFPDFSRYFARALRLA